MDQSVKGSVDELVVESIRQNGGSVEIPRGKFVQRNVVRALRLPSFNRRVVYEAVLRLIKDGVLVRKDLPRSHRNEANKMRLSVKN